MIRADAENLYAPFRQVCAAIPKTARLGGATWGIGFGIKKDEQKALLTILWKIDELTFLILCAEGWDRGSKVHGGFGDSL